jgi:hypothetical protein
MRLFRTVIVADSVMLRLAPEIDWIPVLREFMDVETKRQFAISVSETLSVPSISHIVAAALHAPAAAVQLIDWLNSRLPQLGRNYQQRMSLVERALLMAVGSLRLLCFFFIVAVLGARVAKSFAPSSSLAVLGQWMGGYWWSLALAGVAAMLGLGRVLDEMDTP